MRKTAMLTAFCLCVSFLFTLQGCKGQETPAPEPPEPETTTAADYFPITENTRYVYEGEGSEYASYTVYNDYTTQSEVQQRVDNGGTVAARVITVSGGKVTQTYSSGEVYYRENCLGKTTVEEVLLADPIEAGTEWTLTDGRIRKITGTAVAVSTPAGDYEAVEVVTETEDGTDTRYYAKDVGHIKTVFASNDFTVTSTLAAIESNRALNQTVRFYYPDVDTETIYYLDREIAFETNDVTKDELAASYKEVPAGVGKVLSEGTAINSLALDEDNIPHIDLSRTFLTEMNAGSGYEAMILTCIADTIAGYYTTDKVIITVEGEPYESGHFSFAEGETVSADFDAAVKLP
ncbi:MAG TPA: GerMN domain-containing protein [Candidatus Acidoferrum sp.]|nr:GerMN domain-containing protein [Candidatus Acidoferrum sp.]